MISILEHDVLLSTKNTSLLFHVNEVNKVSIEYYGPKLLSEEEIPSLIRSYPSSQGDTIVYDDKFPGYSLEQAKLACATLGKGDLYSPSLILESEASTLYDFTYQKAEKKEAKPLANLPYPKKAKEELVITLEEKALKVLVELHYIPFEEEDVIGSYVVIKNESGETLKVKKASSLLLPLINNDDVLWSTYGNWVGELTVQKEKLTRGRHVIESYGGSSSNRHNPFFLLAEKNTDYFHGACYGFNLMYSSNFENSVELNSFSSLRVEVGISSTLFEKKVEPSSSFTTPVAIMSYSNKGINTLSDQFHRFVDDHIIPEPFQHKPHPISYNNWEATAMDFNKGKIVSLMKEAASLGIELFVLDDGWFSTRDDDKHGLGDWSVNTKKLSGGLAALGKEAEKLGLKFGIWMEPEMVSPDTKVYKEHPDWVIHEENHVPSKGRNQYTLDLRKKEVQDFIYEAVATTLKSANFSYLKWDYNRDISDFDNRDGTFFYDYITGLYSVMDRLVKEFPNVLFENCASGGNRFDLGMLSYFAQSWMSDDTDSYQRILIQEGGLLGYPLSVMSNHVAAKTSNQMLRKTTFDTKFDVACFGVLGYELDLNDLSKIDKEVISSQIKFYKEHRETCQYGKVYTDQTFVDNDTKMVEVVGEKEALVAQYQKIQTPYPKEGHLYAYGLKEDTLYTYKTRQESIPLSKFGALVNYVAPFHINPDGAMLAMLEKSRDMKSEVDEGIASGSTLSAGGPVLKQEWSGVGYSENIRLIGDFGARLYLIQEKA